MVLADLFRGMEYEILQGTDCMVTGISSDSRLAQAGDLFFCIDGANYAGEMFLCEAAGKLIAAVVAEHPVCVPDEITVVLVKDIRRAMAHASCAFYGYPSKKLLMIGVTGTKGKTTTAFMIYRILQAAGYETGLIGTVAVIDKKGKKPAKNTTPESHALQKMLADMYRQGIRTVVMEVSSQGLMQSRVAGIDFDYGVFTNLSPDHIGAGEHKDYEEYKYWKKQLFSNAGCSVINIDDSSARDMQSMAKKTCITYGVSENADYEAARISFTDTKLPFSVSYTVSGKKDGITGRLDVNMPGMFSVYNSLAATAVCTHIGIPFSVIGDTLGKMCVPGRMERIAVSERFSVFIDYAHNAISLESLLTSLLAYKPDRIILVFGCGGNRSKERRYRMGAVAGKYADTVILTNDNPRYERPEDIIADIQSGIVNPKGEIYTICDRREAIRFAFRKAKDGDVVILAGKGHECYQEIGGVFHPMDERALIYEIMEDENVRTICGYNYRYFA